MSFGPGNGSVKNVINSFWFFNHMGKKMVSDTYAVRFRFFFFFWFVCFLSSVAIVLKMVSRKISLEKLVWLAKNILFSGFASTLFTRFVLNKLSPITLLPLAPAHLWYNLPRSCFPWTHKNMLADKIQHLPGVASFLQEPLTI